MRKTSRAEKDPGQKCLEIPLWCRRVSFDRIPVVGAYVHIASVVEHTTWRFKSDHTRVSHLCAVCLSLLNCPYALWKSLASPTLTTFGSVLKINVRR